MTVTPIRPLPDTMFGAQEWRLWAECRAEPTDAFYFEEIRGRAKRAAEQAAKDVCAGCLVRAECLDYALRKPEVFGVWGGLTEEERGWRKSARIHPPNGPETGPDGVTSPGTR